MFPSFIALSVLVTVFDFTRADVLRIPLSNLASTTPYQPPEDHTNWNEPPFECLREPIFIFYLARHGARHTDKIDNIEQLKKKLLSFQTTSTWLYDWKYPAHPSSQLNLLKRGMKEHFNIATRLREKFPSAFPSVRWPYDPNDFHIRSSEETRTGQSAASFCYAALRIDEHDTYTAHQNSPNSGGVASKSSGGGGKISDEEKDVSFLPFGFVPPHINVASKSDTGDGLDSVLRFHSACPLYQSTVTNNPFADPEYDNYLNSPEFHEVIDSFAYRTDVPSDQLEPTDIIFAFEACAFDLLLTNDDTMWCSLLDSHAIDVVNYAKDLKKYYKFGPGHEINSKMPMMLLKQMFEGFDRAIDTYETKGSPSGNWLFGHDETTTPFKTMLGLFEDQEKAPLLASNRNESRSFRTSLVGPFANNLVGTLHSCHDGSYKVRFASNEKEVVLPGCNGELFCDVEVLKAYFNEPLNVWSYDEVCGGECTCSWDEAAPVKEELTSEQDKLIQSPLSVVGDPSQLYKEHYDAFPSAQHGRFRGSH